MRDETPDHKPKLLVKNRRKAAKYRGHDCLNCKHQLTLSDVYCSYCGQLNTTKTLSLKDFFGEFLGSLFTYDSRLRYTIRDLLFRPGVITRNYVNGQRLRYANPFRFFLSVSIIYFVLQGLIGTFDEEDANVFNKTAADGKDIKFQSTGDAIQTFGNGIDSLAQEVQERIDEVQADSLAKKYGYPNQKKLDSIIQSSAIKGKEFVTKKKKDTVQSYTLVSEANLGTLSGPERLFSRGKLYYDFYKTTKIKKGGLAMDSLRHNNTRFNRWMYERNEMYERVAKNPTDFITYLAEKTPFFVFFFTPFYAFFFWLIYSKEKHTYMEHMVFIFHIFSFIFLAMLIFLIPDTLIGQDIFTGILIGIIGPFYFYKALRNFYKENRAITIIKFIFLNIVFSVSATITAVLFFLVTAAMY
ncbi:MAG: hypothetical protein ACI86C_001590 [Candidatus Latescibacterota bacterium]|jgi:hypothetical protein